MGNVLTNTALPLNAAAPVVADPSKIVANPGHLVLLAVVALAIVGYLLYRRTRHNHNSRSIDEYTHEEGHDDRRGHHHE